MSGILSGIRSKSAIIEEITQNVKISNQNYRLLCDYFTLNNLKYEGMSFVTTNNASYTIRDITVPNHGTFMIAFSMGSEQHHTYACASLRIGAHHAPNLWQQELGSIVHGAPGGFSIVKPFDTVIRISKIAGNSYSNTCNGHLGFWYSTA